MSHQPALGQQDRQPDPLRGGNPFGLIEALIGFALAEVLAGVLVALYSAARGHAVSAHSFGALIVDLIGVWVGFFGACVVASLAFRRRRGVHGKRLWPTLRRDYGLAIRLWPDVPLGIALGAGSQYLLVPALEAPLLPFVPHLYERLGNPAHQITGQTHGAGLVVLALFLCLGSPFFEELFFRGLVLRGIVGRFEQHGRRLAEGIGVVGSGLLFGLAHFEPLQFLALFGFGVVLAVLARRTGRLGPGIVAHSAFNAVTVIAIAIAR